MTPMPASPFLSNSVDGSPPSPTDTAAAPSPGKGDAAAELSPDVQATRRLDDLGSVQDGRKMSTDGQPAATGRTVAAGLTHNPVTQAVEVRPQTDHIHEIFHRSRPARFAPDLHAIWDAVHDPDAPRHRLLGDPVWADDPPIFLKRVR